MLLTEFETHTNMYPDTILYEIIEREYNETEENGCPIWDSKANFCHAYKFNEDGLAEKCQRLANEEIWRREEAHRKAMTESAARIEELYKECKALQERLDRAEKECAMYKQDNETMRREMQHMEEDQRRATMFRVLERYVREDVGPDTIGCKVYAFVDLLREEGLHE